MYLLALGLVLLGMKWLAWGPVATWDWWWVLSPFALAAVWWAWADHSGYTRRKVVEREDERKQARLERQRDQLGLTRRKR